MIGRAVVVTYENVFIILSDNLRKFYEVTMAKSQTDVNINDFIGLLFISTLLP